jgi:hypothetical protein
LSQVLGLAYGPDTRALLIAIGEIIGHAVVRIEMNAERTVMDRSRSWIGQRRKRRAVIAALRSLLKEFDPNADPTEDKEGEEAATLVLDAALGRGDRESVASQLLQLSMNEIREPLAPLTDWLRKGDDAR